MKKLYYILFFVALSGCKKSEDGTVEVIPLAPTELKGTLVSKDQVDLSWKDNSTNETGYKIERKTDSGVFAEIGSTATDVPTFSDKTVSININYSYRVYSYNKVGKSINYSNEVSIKTLFNIVVGANGRIWMDRNLGATRVATSFTDAESYGDLYQWGRGTDGHQIRTTATTTTLSSTDQPGNGTFILASNSSIDWRSPKNDNLWQGVNGTNNPCPSGYRLPTEAEWTTEINSWSSKNATGAFASPLKLPVAGLRYDYNNWLPVVGGGHYWSSTVSGTNSRSMGFSSGSNTAYFNTYYRAYGLCVRCIKN